MNDDHLHESPETPALAPPVIADALTLAVRMGRVELADDGHVSEGCWALCDALHDALTDVLTDEQPRRR